MSGNSEEVNLLNELSKLLDDIHEFADNNIAKPLNDFTDNNIKKPLKDNLNIKLQNNLVYYHRAFFLLLRAY